MNEEMILKFHNEVAIAAKYQAINAKGPHTDISPYIQASFVDGSHYTGHPRQASIKHIAESGNMMGWIATSTRALWVHKNKVPLLNLSMCLEGYQQAEAGDDINALYANLPGDLEKDFRMNPASKVTEMLATYVCENDAVGQFQMWSVSQPYHYSDGGVLVLGDVLYTDAEDPRVTTTGVAPAALIELFSEIGRKP